MSPNIPAGAGSRHGPWVRRRNASDHPRGCGEHTSSVAFATAHSDLSAHQSLEGVIAA